MGERKTAGAAVRLEEGCRRTGGVNTRRVLEGGTAAGPEGGQLDSGWRQLGAGRGSWRLITAAAPGLRKEQSPKTNRGHSRPGSHGPSASALPSPGVAPPGRVGDSRPARKFFFTETASQHRRVFLVRDWETHPLSSLYPPSGARGVWLRDVTRYAEPTGVGCSRWVSLPLRRHRRQFASPPRGC